MSCLTDDCAVLFLLTKAWRSRVQATPLGAELSEQCLQASVARRELGVEVILANEPAYVACVLTVLERGTDHVVLQQTITHSERCLGYQSASQICQVVP